MLTLEQIQMASNNKLRTPKRKYVRREIDKDWSEDANDNDNNNNNNRVMRSCRTKKSKVSQTLSDMGAIRKGENTIANSKLRLLCREKLYDSTDDSSSSSSDEDTWKIHERPRKEKLIVPPKRKTSRITDSDVETTPDDNAPESPFSYDEMVNDILDSLSSSDTDHNNNDKKKKNKEWLKKWFVEDSAEECLHVEDHEDEDHETTMNFNGRDEFF